VWQIDSLPALSVVASILEIGGAPAIGFAGLAIVRSEGLASFGRAPDATGQPA
jgi:hypothetical protein